MVFTRCGVCAPPCTDRRAAGRAGRPAGRGQRGLGGEEAADRGQVLPRHRDVKVWGVVFELDIQRGRDKVLMRGSMVTPVCAHAGFDSMECGCKSACCKRISRVTGHLWTGLRNSASSLQITARLGASHATFRARKLETGLDANQA